MEEEEGRMKKKKDSDEKRGVRNVLICTHTQRVCALYLITYNQIHSLVISFFLSSLSLSLSSLSDLEIEGYGINRFLVFPGKVLKCASKEGLGKEEHVRNVKPSH